MLETNWVLGSNAAMRRIARSIERAAEVECTVLVSGETGTGKELWARLLHRSGPRRNKAFVPVNCAALTPSLAESQLFGHEKGAFTGAAGKSLGIFRAAQGGVVFLDEIGEMPSELQPKLLRVLQQREVLPVGASEPVSIDVQIVAATNRELELEVEKGTFREDLYYRLNMIELRVPSLRERPEDIQPFDRKHNDRSRFDCGVTALNQYLRASLGQHGRRDLTRGYVAVDKAWQGRGIGAMLLAYALRVAVEGAESIASAVIEADVKDETARSFYARFGFRSLTDDRLHMFLPMKTARQAVGKA